MHNRQQPYRLWQLSTLETKLLTQAKYFGYSGKEQADISVMVQDANWNPLIEFDGCTGVSDYMQPFLPCFIHDYHCIVSGWSKVFDKQFKSDLIRCGFPKWKAQMYYLGVRAAWHFYYKWKND